MEYKSSVIRESVASPPETLAPGTEEQRNRGTEEQRNRGKKRTHDPEEAHDRNVREFSQSEIEEAGEILSALSGSLMDPLEVSVAVELITEAAREPVQNLTAYLNASVESSRDRVIGLCEESRRQVERTRAA